MNIKLLSKYVEDCKQVPWENQAIHHENIPL